MLSFCVEEKVVWKLYYYIDVCRCNIWKEETRM